MNNKYFWSNETFSSGYVPENWQDIVDTANEKISVYAETHSEDETEEYSQHLWEQFCSTEEI